MRKTLRRLEEDQEKLFIRPRIKKTKGVLLIEEGIETMLEILPFLFIIFFLFDVSSLIVIILCAYV